MTKLIQANQPTAIVIVQCDYDRVEVERGIDRDTLDGRWYVLAWEGEYDEELESWEPKIDGNFERLDGLYTKRNACLLAATIAANLREHGVHVVNRYRETKCRLPEVRYVEDEPRAYRLSQADQI